MTTSEDLYAEQFEEDDAEIFEEDRGEILEDEHEGGNASEAEEAPAENSNKQPVKPKRIVRNPQPKLNEETLKGKRGLTALPSYFERVKYKGRGHEEEDLTVILKTYEYWCHRLFPKYPFDECIAKIEKLGSKKAVVTHIKKIRLNMLQDEDEPVLDNDNSDVEENIINDDSNIFDDLDISDVQAPVEITEEQQEQIRLNRERAEQIRRERLQRAQERSESFLRDSQEFSQVSDLDIHNLTPEAGTSNTDTQPPVELTEEQQERIRQNRQRAERLRQEKLKKLESSLLNDSSMTTLGESLSQISPTPTSGNDVENSFPFTSHADADTTFHKTPRSERQEHVTGEEMDPPEATVADNNERHLIQSENLDELPEEQEASEIPEDQ